MKKIHYLTVARVWPKLWSLGVSVSFSDPILLIHFGPFTLMIGPHTRSETTAKQLATKER